MKIETSQPTVARWESGVQLPSLRSLLKVGKATGNDLVVTLRPSEANTEIEMVVVDTEIGRALDDEEAYLEDTARQTM